VSIQQILIPFNRSSLEGRELEFIFRTISIGQIAGDQMFSQKCHGLLEEVVGVRRALGSLRGQALIIDI
jgi:dTDP-4-amino-4,6-dideoxygalactose transaminase